MKKAIVLGGTGLVGSNLINHLTGDKRFDSILVVTRRPLLNKNPKIRELVVDFDKPEDWAGSIIGDVLFSAFGTTIKKAGSKEVQYKIDYHYQYLVARLAAENGVPDCVLVSSPGANPDSRIFYTRMKGDLDRDVSKLGFDRLRILKPSVLVGKRPENRIGENIGIVIGHLLFWIPGLRKYRPITGEKVARAMIKAWSDDHPMQIVLYGPGELHKISRTDA